MKRFRTVFFWCHLTAGVVAGLVIFLMSVTGALLAFERQILDLLERDVQQVPLPGNGTERVSMSRMLTAAAQYKPGVQLTGITIEADREASAAVSFGRAGTVYVNPYSGAVLGEGAVTARAVFQTLTSWHRWLGSEGSFRQTARAMTGAANLAFLGLALSGLYLWWPRRWTGNHLRAVTMFDRQARGKVRDFNWHNVIGFWCAPVLIVLTATAVVMSYPWANALLYRMTASTPPPAAAPPGQAGGGAGGRAGGPAPSGDEQRQQDASARSRAVEVPDNLDMLLVRAEQILPTWSSITLRLAGRPGGAVSFTLTDGAHWNAFARSQLTLDAATGDTIRWEPYTHTSLGQKARGWVRFGHTGELGGWPGQLVAGVACMGGSVLVGPASHWHCADS
jgi:uncharacterized iron-regulated membrane protein